MAGLHIQTFSARFADDITHLYRNNFVNCAAILLQAVKAPLFYIILTVGTFVLRRFAFDNIFVAILLSVISACLVVIAVIYGIIYCKERFNGHLYPTKLSQMDGGVFILAVDKGKTPAKLAGSIAVEPVSNDVAALNVACVDSNYRGRGAFQKLFKSAIDHCNTIGFTFVKTEVWNVSIPFLSMIPILERRGFVVKEGFFAPSLFVPVLRAYKMEKRLPN